jgi:uncharacterized protein YgiM (DUF1202 family)
MKAYAALLCIGLFAAGGTASAQQAGGFFGDLVLKPLADGVTMEVGAPFGFIDGKGRRWEVEAGDKTDGASIPRALWSIVGSPFTGRYLRAAVIHDRYCDNKHRSWMDTHEIFYEAMLASGVAQKQALLMWAAVYRFGPRWTRSESVCWETCAGGNVFLEDVEIRPVFLQDVFDGIRRRLDQPGGASKEDLQKFIDDELGSKQLTNEAPARMRGFISSYLDERPDPRREFVADDPLPSNWFNFGTPNIRQYAYKVVRVRAPDTLRMRSGPGTSYAEVGAIPADGTGITIQGRCKTIWCRVRFGTQEGWINTSFLALDFAFYKFNRDP